MSATETEATTLGPAVPIEPPTGPVELDTEVGKHDDDAAKVLPIHRRTLIRMTTGTRRAFSGGLAWVKADGLDEDKLEAEVTTRRQRSAVRENETYKERIAGLQAELRAAHGTDEQRAVQLTKELQTLKAMGPVPVDERKVTSRDVRRARWNKRLGRATAVAAGAYGAATFVATAPGYLLLIAPAAAAGAWWAGRPESDDDDDQEDDHDQVDGKQDEAVVLAEQSLERAPKVELTKDLNPLMPVEPEVMEAVASAVNDVNVKPGSKKQDAQAQASAHLTRVFQEAGVIRAGQKVKVVALPVHDANAQIVTIDLPGGVTARKAKERTEPVASALGVDAVQVDIEQAAHSGQITLWVADGDPFEIPRTSPLIDLLDGIGGDLPLNTWAKGAPICFTRRGVLIYWPIRDSGLLAAGATRSGKGVLLSDLVFAAALDPRVNVRLVDGKGSGEWNAMAPILASFFKLEPRHLNDVLAVLLAEMNRRAEWLDERDLEKLDEENIEAIGGIELFVVDELATYTAKNSNNWREEILEFLAQLSAVAASMGIIFVLATQVPEVDVITGRLRQNITSRAANRTESPAQSNTILGDGMAGRGYDASAIPLSQRGRGWLLSPETGAIEFRSIYIKPEEKARIIKEAIRLREEAGRLPGQWDDPIEAALVRRTGISTAAGGESGRGRIVRKLTPAQQAVEDALSVMDQREADRIRTEPLLDGLKAHDPATYGEMTGKELGALLREAEVGGTVALGPLDGLANPRGYKREALESARS